MTETNSLHLEAAHRVVVLAPHPDDESIACGGLLLAALDAGASCSVVIVTDGDNNPWPQRWMEKRWHIDDAARARWGARRRAEADAALDVLGVGEAQRHFLGMPDSELTSLLMRDASLVDELGGILERIRPTHLALPALEDRHPDHSAVHVAARLALSRTSMSPQMLIYAVHGQIAGQGAKVVALSEPMRCVKRDAILKHQTQMRLSGKRFLRFARESEDYETVTDAPRDDLPLRAKFCSGFVDICVDAPRLRDVVGTLKLLVCVDDPAGEGLRLQAPLAEAKRGVEMQVFAGIPAQGMLRWQSQTGLLTTRIPFDKTNTSTGFVKLAKSRPALVIYDRYGWQAIEK